MWRLVLAIGVAGCANPPAPEQRPLLDAPAIDVGVAFVAGAARAPAAIHTGVPDGSLVQLAVPSDGSYLVSSDTGGSVRLWPSFDGRHAPVIVKTQTASVIATVADGEAITIAVLDSLGELELVRITRAGAALERRAIDRERPIFQLVATSRGFVALQDDQQLLALDPHGGVISTLRPAPGERIVSLIARGDHVLAMLDSARRGRRKGRWLALGDTLVWGAQTAAFLASPDDALVLSPDGTHVAARTSSDRRATIAVIDLATGTAASPIAVAYEAADPKVFLDDQTIVFGNEGELYRWVPGMAVVRVPFLMGAAVMVGKTLVMPREQTLALVTGSKTKYLGYHVSGLTDIVASDHGWLATDARSLVHLDHELQLTEVLATGREDTVTLIDGAHAVTEAQGHLDLHDLATGHSTRLSIYGYLTSFQRSTGLGLLYRDTKPLIVRWDPVHATLSSTLIDVGEIAAIDLYDPAGTHGVVAAFGKLTSTDMLEVTTIGEVSRRGTFEHVHTHTVTIPELERAGSEVFEQQLPATHPIVPSHDGSLIAETNAGRLTLHDRDGNVRWARLTPGPVAWNADDDLVAIDGGAARIELETGELDEAVCGWGFGLWDELPQSSQPTSNARLCE